MMSVNGQSYRQVLLDRWVSGAWIGNWLVDQDSSEVAPFELMSR